MQSELIKPERWIGVRTRGGQRFWSEISQEMIHEEGKIENRHEFLGYYDTPEDAAIVRDARVIEMKLPVDNLNFPYLEPQRISQLANQAKERQLRANQRLTLGTGTEKQTLNDLVETFAEESNSDTPLLERKLVEIPIPSSIRSQENFSGPDNQYRYFVWEQEEEWFLDRYEQDDESVWIRRWENPQIFKTHLEAVMAMEKEMERDNGEEGYNKQGISSW